MLDIDGCLADFNKSYVSLLEEISGKELPKVGKEWPTKWDYALDHVTPADERVAWEKITSNRGNFNFWFDLLPYGDIDKVRIKVNSLVENYGHDVYFVTSRPGMGAKQQTEAWLYTMGFAQPSTVIISHKKGLVAGGVEANLAIDDKPENLVDVIRSRGTACKCLLLDRPWNQGHELGALIGRVGSMEEGLGFVK